MNDITTGMILSQIAQHATEVAAIASAKLTGFGRKNDADQAAVDAMRRSFQIAPFSGKVVIGGGFTTSGLTSSLVTADNPTSDTTWSMTVAESQTGTPTWTLTAFAVCITALP